MIEKLYPEDHLISKPLLLGNHVFPGLWRYIFPKDISSIKFPKEQKSSCMNCPKSECHGYRPDYRCCTFHPRVGNFMLGLATDTEKGMESFIDLKNLGMLTPEGMNQTPVQWYDYLDDVEKELFGKSQKILCPMLDTSNGYCKIHAFRNGVCSTFFCEKDYEDLSTEFWGSLSVLVGQIEMALTQWSMRYIGFDLEAYMHRFDSLAKDFTAVSNKENKGWSEAALKHLWGEWYGKELEFYRLCAKAIMDHIDVLWEIASETDILEASKFDKVMHENVPDTLKKHVEPEDLEEGDPAELSELWEDLDESYTKLWTPIEFAEYEWAENIDIVENPGKTKEEKYNAAKNYIIHFYNEEELPEVVEKLYVTVEQAELLKLFEEGLDLGWELLSSKEARKVDEVRDFLKSMIEQVVLVTEEYEDDEE